MGGPDATSFFAGMANKLMAVDMGGNRKCGVRSAKKECQAPRPSRGGQIRLTKETVLMDNRWPQGDPDFLKSDRGTHRHNMKAILSDIHGNIEALNAVLADIHSRGIEEIVCLCDIIGYGPNPRECLEIACRESEPLIMGNHEEAVIEGDATAFNSRARRAVDWTRDQLVGPDVPEEEAEKHREMFKRFVKEADVEGVKYYHGSPRNPTREYVTTRDVRNKQKMGAIFDALESVCFIGHTHIPGVFTEGGHSTPEDLFGVYMISGEKALINVGSVGQPRDGDPRACYATFDIDTVVFHRVEYDVEAVVAKIRATPSLDNTLAERLRVGR